MRPLLCLLLLPTLILADKPPAPPRTVAEVSDYKATSRHADVVAFCDALPVQSNAVKVDTLGKTHEGRAIPMLVVADPPVSNPQGVGTRTVVVIVANIHAGEVDGKEAVLMLARDIATSKDRDLLKHLVLLIVPNFNADGNEKLAKTNRTDQNGPPEVGTRANAQGLDLNRDFVKLESPEVRALVSLVNTWDPSVLIDMHTTDGSYHRYAVTYDGPRNPAGDGRIISLARDTLLPAINKQMQERDRLASFFYGNFSKDHKSWVSYNATPRYGIAYMGLRNRLALLCESYSHAPFKDRVKASYSYARSAIEQIAANRDKLRAVLTEAREGVIRGGRKPRGDDQIAVRMKTVAFKEPVTILGFEEETKDGKIVSTGKPRDYKVERVARCEASLSVLRPFAYLYPATLTSVTELLQRHGIDAEELREDIELDIEAYRIDSITKSPIAFQKHNTQRVEATSRKESRRIPAGTIVVRTAQSLGTLAAYLLEPLSDDGLVTWNFFDAAMTQGKDFPILRLPAPAFFTSGRARSLTEPAQAKKKPITLEALMAGRLPSFSGTPVGGIVWLDDEHFLQTKSRQLLKVHAATGKATPFVDQEKLTRGLASITGMTRREAELLAGSPLNMNPQRSGILVTHGGDLWYCPFDTEKAIRLTKKDGREELASFSPDGKHVAFVRAGNLHVVDLATQTEKALTSDGSNVIFNGKAGWVYFEEIFNRNWNAFWWSHDSKHIAFFRTDESKLRKFTVLDELPLYQTVETTPYPKAGEVNPEVKLGVVSITSGSVDWIDVENNLVSRVGWSPDGRDLYWYLQDRTQTYLSLNMASIPYRRERRVVFRDSTKAWIDDPGPPVFLKDGSFLWQSERSGWKHLYHYARDGKLIKQVTTGDWEVRQFLRLDEAGGWVYFLATKDSHLAQNLYRVKLDGSNLTRLTHTSGDHIVSPRFGAEPPTSISETGGYFIDTWSDNTTPAKVALFKGDGSLVRRLDTNPVHVLDQYEFLPWESVQIKTPDGFLLEGMILSPPRPDPKKKYPVWVKTYGGPHAPTIKDAWQAGRIEDQAHARAGYIVFRVDPRSASGKGAAASWTCYKQLGVQELKDMETAVTWLCQRSYVDASRIGLSGHSYGGFLTSYALTHSKLFAAGIAGAPVTDWTLYDSIYTERYMLTPKENPDGYAKTSVVKAAKNLHGKLLLLHGMMDDNVHVQNTLRLVDELQKADRTFELMLYPRARHPLFGGHYRRLMNEFMQKALKPEM